MVDFDLPALTKVTTLEVIVEAPEGFLTGFEATATCPLTGLLDPLLTFVLLEFVAVTVLAEENFDIEYKNNRCYE